MVLECPCLALEAQLIQNLLTKPLTKFGTCTSASTHGIAQNRLGFGRAPPCGLNNIGIYGHGVGLSLFGLGGPINANSVK